MFDFTDPTETVKWIGILVPLLVGIITKKYAAPGLKSVLNLLTSAVLGSLGYLIAESGGYNLSGFIENALETFFVSIVAYYGFLKPTGVAGTVTEATARFGVGKPTMTTDDKGAEDAGDVAA